MKFCNERMDEQDVYCLKNGMTLRICVFEVEQGRKMLVIRTLLKILVLPLVFVSWFLWFIARMLTDLSSYVTGPLMLFIFVCGIYTIMKRLWSQTLILVLMEASCCFVIFCASFIIFILEEWSHRLLDFMFS